MKIKSTTLGFILLILSWQCFADDNEWSTYGGDQNGTRYSSLTQITPTNVKQLKIAWTYHSGDVVGPQTNHRPTAFEATPILFNKILYLCTPFNRVIALNPATGQELWSYDPHVYFNRDYAGPLRCRGVSVWQDNTKPLGEFCQQRIFTGTIDGRVIALDAKTGKLCSDFGKQGQINLNTLNNYGGGDLLIMISSAPTIYHDLVIVGSSINDNQRTNSPHGIVRAFDARTGKQKWSWDPIPSNLSNVTGAANVWAPMSVDTERGILFLPTTSPSPDYYGGNRTKPIPFENSVVALNATTGKILWHFQTVHHNLWDYDLPSQPSLINIERDGKIIPAVAQSTKTGFIFLLDRLTGIPLYPVTEKSVPQSTVPGEITSPTQPFPVLPKAQIQQALASKDAWGLMYFDRVWCRSQIEKLDNEGIFTPPSVRGTLQLPGPAGGNNWGGMAFDANAGLLVVNTSNLAYVVHLIPRENYLSAHQKYPGAEISPQTGTPYGLERAPLISPLGIPCNPPPWGQLTAIDVNNGQIRWQIPFGAVKKGFFITPEKWGSPNIGGPMITASGLIFIGAGMDNRIHAYNLQSGAEVWHYGLPADGAATPMTYELNGKQYVVIAAGGGRISSHFSDALVAFALPENITVRNH